MENEVSLKQIEELVDHCGSQKALEEKLGAASGLVSGWLSERTAPGPKYQKKLKSMYTRMAQPNGKTNGKSPRTRAGRLKVSQDRLNRVTEEYARQLPNVALQAVAQEADVRLSKARFIIVGFLETMDEEKYKDLIEALNEG